jgi:hypothetical protein
MFLHNYANKIKNFIQTCEYNQFHYSHLNSPVIVSSCNCNFVTESCNNCQQNFKQTIDYILESSGTIDKKYRFIGFIVIVDYCCEHPYITKQNKSLLTAIYQTMQLINPHREEFCEPLKSMYTNIDLKSDWDLFH